MKKILTIIFLLTFTHVYSQTPTWEWAKSATGNGEGWCVSTDAAGDVYLCGMFYGSVTFGPYTLTDPDTGYLHVFLVKYDASGNVLWAKNSSGQTAAYVTSISSDAAGNTYLTGCYSGNSITFSSTVLTNTGGFDIFLIKYNSVGNINWAKNIGGTADDICYSVASNKLGDVFITGFYSSPNLIFGSDTLTLSGIEDLFIAKLDSAGNFIWARTSIGITNDYAYGVATDALGNAYITGIFTSTSIIFGNDTLTNTGESDFFIVKYDSNGNENWAKGATGTGIDYGVSLATNSFGKIFATGYFNSPDLIFGSHTVHSSPANADVFTVQFDSSGNVDWANYSTGAGNAWGYFVAADAHGNAYVTGWMFTDFISFDTIVLPLMGSADPMFIVRYDSTGQATFAVELTSGGDDENSVAIDTTGDIYIGGDFAINPFIVGNDTLILTGGETPFVAKLSFHFGEGISEVNSNMEGTLFPNPFDDKLNIVAKENEPTEIILYNILSRKFLQKTFTNSITLNTSQLANGIYIYELKDKNGAIRKGKVIKQ